MRLSRRFDQLSWDLVPGPLTLTDPAYSIQIDESVDYPPKVVEQAILSVPNTRLLSTSKPSWWEWKAQHTAADGEVLVSFSLFETTPVLWGGSSLEIDCGPRSLLEFWLKIRESCPAIWLHDEDCRLYSPDGFREVFL